jgi:chromosome partitioning protein
MKVVSVINYKGGVGKTSLTANLGAELAFRGRKVLLLDMDAQASLTFSFISPEEWSAKYASDKTIKSWFDSHEQGVPIPLRRLIQTPKRVAERIPGEGRLDIIFSHLGLINVDLDLAIHLIGASLPQQRKNFIKVHRRLSDGLKKLAEARRYDIVLIDCPPNFNIVTKTALIASDYILVPTRPDALSTWGIDYLIRSITELIDNYNEFVDLQPNSSEVRIEPKIIGVVFTMVQEYGAGPISAQRNFIASVRENSGLTVFDSYIKRNDTLFADAPQYGVPVVLNRHTHASHQSVVDGLEEVATEFESAIGLTA